MKIVSRVASRIHSLIARRYVDEYSTEFSPLMRIKFCGNAKPHFSVGIHSHSPGMCIYCWDPTISVTIGNYCSVAQDVSIIAGGEHDVTWATTSPIIDWWKLEQFYDLRKPRFKGHITIGHDVWIGHRATILSGVKIGHGAVIGAGAMVTKSIPPYAIVAGNPAKLIRYRFGEAIIQRLLDTCWWELGREELTTFAGLLPNVEMFIAALERYRTNDEV